LRKSVSVKGLYCIIDSTEKVKEICKGGADIIQLRLKDIPDKEIFFLAKKTKEITDKYNILFFINDRVDIAVLVGADGVHLGQNDLPVREVKRLFPDFIVGISTHSISEALEAQKNGADYISIGPIFKSPTKPELTPVGLELLKEIKQKVRIPVVAIGGINEKNIEIVKKTKVDSIAVISAISKSKNIELAVRKLKNKFSQ